MLFRKEVLDRIRQGKITLAFRRWRRPSARAGGTLLTSVGQLDIGSVSTVSLEDISVTDARRAGYASLAALRSELQLREEGKIYRIELGALRPDPRIALRDSLVADDTQMRKIMQQLQRLDSRASGEAWTLRTLEVLSAHPGVRAGDLCEHVGQEKKQFKLNVRKLKNLGLTVSLGTGYRLSRRGAKLLDDLRSWSFPDAT